MFSGRIVTSASSGFRPAASSAAFTASKPALLESTSIAPSSSVIDVVGAGLERDFHHLVLARAGREDELAAVP